jgi:5-carboxymethyl-2-hydroxymuconate isomerase
MAHFILEYSDNLEESDESIQRLFTLLHQSAVKTGLFPFKGIRSRAYCCTQYRMANGNPEHGFAHLEVKLGSGRSLAERQQASEAFFDIFCAHFDEQISQKGMALSFEMKELEAVLKFNKNNIADYLD